MKQMVVLFALVACSLASPAVTSYSYKEVAPVMQYVNHIPSFYKAFPYLAGSSYVASPYMAGSSYVASPYMAGSSYVASPYVASPYVASSYVASPYVSKVATPYVSSVAAPVVAAPVVSSAQVVTPYVAPVAAAADIKSQYHTQEHFTGQAAYGHAEPGQVHNAVQDAAGNKVGSFSHVLPDGSVAHTDYVADAMGYRVSSNALPVGPVNTMAPVADTVEVAAAKAAHFAEVEKIKMRSKRDIAYTTAAHYPSYAAYSTPYSTYSYPQYSNFGYSGISSYSTPYNYHLY